MAMLFSVVVVVGLFRANAASFVVAFDEPFAVAAVFEIHRDRVAALWAIVGALFARFFDARHEQHFPVDSRVVAVGANGADDVAVSLQVAAQRLRVCVEPFSRCQPLHRVEHLWGDHWGARATIYAERAGDDLNGRAADGDGDVRTVVFDLICFHDPQVPKTAPGRLQKGSNPKPENTREFGFREKKFRGVPETALAGA